MDVERLRHLQTSLARIDYLVRWAVARAQAAGHDPAASLSGLVITDEEVNAHLAEAPLAGLWAAGEAADPARTDYRQPAQAIDRGEAAEGADKPLPRLVRAFGLTPLERDILLVCIAPELDRRYERLFAYLHDDVSKQRPTVNLVMNLLGANLEGRFEVWERLTPEAPLRAHHLITCLPDPNQHDPVFLAYQLKIDHRILMHLLGDATPDSRLDRAVYLTLPDQISPESNPPALPLATIKERLSDSPMVHMQGQTAPDRYAVAAALCADVGLPLIHVDLARLKALAAPFTLAWQLAVREGQLAEGALLLEGWEYCLDDRDRPPPGLWERLLAYEEPVFLCGEATSWEPRDAERARRLLRVRLEMPRHVERVRLWEQALATPTAGHSAQPPDQLTDLASKFRLTSAQIAGAVQTAADLAASRGERIGMVDLYAGARAHSSARLGKLAQKVKSRFAWDDLILPPNRLAQLRELCERARYADAVHDDWGFGKKVAPERGVSALFAGESGTGKTMAASVVAGELGLEMYKIDLSAIVSKYIGETEKNLSAIFAEARASNAILFFDEADALFGKRSEVRDAHDRYANIEIAYLLQQIETYDGITVLATNLRQNLDEAFTRRLDFVVDFPFPDAEHRRRIWAVNFPPEAPLAPEVDLDVLAQRFRLAGGNIRNAALASAYLAAADGKMIEMAHVLHAVRREHQKMGRLLDEALDPSLLDRP